VDLLGPLSGEMPVRCSLCNDVKLWEISVESLLVLFTNLSDKKLLEFSQRLLEMSKKVVDLDDPAVM
jgi:LSD1 subclass zinc finger protein